MSLLGLGLKSKNKEKEKGAKLKKVRTVEDPIKPSANGKIHKRFSSLNSLPNAFKRSSKPDDKERRKQDYFVPIVSQKQVHYKLKFVSQVAHDRDTYATSNISP